MDIDFEKWHGCLNDFIVIHHDSKDQGIRDLLQKKARQLCKRNGSSIGADGILFIGRDDKNNFLLDIINSDGSLAANCGNGLRCAAASIKVKNPDLKSIPIHVKDNIFSCNIIETNSTNLISVQMPIVKLNQKHLLDAALDSIPKSKYPYTSISTVDVGNQHIVLFFDSTLKEIDSEFYTLGSQIQKSSHWDGINLHFCSLQNKDVKSLSIDGNKADIIIDAKTWERGVGPTAACGSGAVSVAYAYQHGQGSSSNFLTGIKMPGGVLYIRETFGKCELIGPAELAFKGQIKIN